jgi:hypothetical protein
MNNLRVILSFAALFLILPIQSHATIGFGVHWGNDFSLKMDDVSRKQLSFGDLSIDPASVYGIKPDSLGLISGSILPIYIDQSSWRKKPFNIGAKIFIDIIPVLDAIEISTNFGVWEYKSSLIYPVSMSYRQNSNNYNHPDSLFDVEYDTLPLSLEKFDMEFLGLKNTPFMKLHFDLTIRKNIFEAPAKILRIYAGAGPSLHFATPVLNKELIEEALGEAIKGEKPLSVLSENVFENDQLTKKIMKKITRSLMIPHWGCHIIAGTMLKLPVVPIGFYFDGKLMIPFDNVDKHNDLGGLGLLLNTGISLSF